MFTVSMHVAAIVYSGGSELCLISWRYLLSSSLFQVTEMFPSFCCVPDESRIINGDTNHPKLRKSEVDIAYNYIQSWPQR